jgi:ParB family chromosome partitioning protein
MTPKRKGPSRLMASMEGRVKELGATFISGDSTVNHSFEVAIDKVQPDPNQSRKAFSETTIDDLASSLAEHGQLMPVLVRPDPETRGSWILVAGERRWRAAAKAGLKTLLAIERSSAYEVASLLENIQREDLTLLEEAQGIKELISLKGWSQRDAAKNLSKSLSHINGMLGVLKLPEDFLNTVLKSEHPLPRNLLIELARVQDSKKQEEFCSLALRGELTIQKIREGVHNAKQTTEKQNIKAGQPNRLGALTKALSKWESVSPQEMGEADRLELRRVAKAILARLGDEIP